jgi:hypothetical protein
VKPSDDDLLFLANWAGEKKGALPEQTVYLACGQLRLFVAQKYNDRHKLLDPDVLKFLWVIDFPMFEWDEEDQRWNAAHHPFTSVHDEDLEKLTRSGALPCEILRSGAERRRTRLWLHSYSSPRRPVKGLLGASASPKKKQNGASDSCSKHLNTVRLRTAASHSGSIGWSCSWLANNPSAK